MDFGMRSSGGSKAKVHPGCDLGCTASAHDCGMLYTPQKSAYIRFALECHTNIIQSIHYLLKSCVHAADTAIDVGKHSIHHVFLQCGFGQEKVSERSRFRGILTVEGIS